MMIRKFGKKENKRMTEYDFLGNQI